MSLMDREKENIRKTWAKRHESAKMAQKKKRQVAMSKAHAIAKLLKEKYGVKKVYLYGSLSREGPFDKLSDIDLFVEGWNEDFNYWKMYLEAESIAIPFPVSIITENEVIPELHGEILKKGEILL